MFVDAFRVTGKSPLVAWAAHRWTICAPPGASRPARADEAFAGYARSRGLARDQSPEPDADTGISVENLLVGAIGWFIRSRNGRHGGAGKSRLASMKS